MNATTPNLQNIKENTHSIDCHELRKVFSEDSPKRTVALQGVTMQLKPGMIHGLIGPNGAGKTTLLRILATIISPTSGKVNIANLPAATEKETIRRKIGFLSSSTGLYERLTGREILTYFGHLYNMSAIEITSSTEKLCELLDMSQFIDRNCGILSQGQKQRVSIARSMIHSPEIFILDEPTNGLDVMTSRTIVRFIQFLRQEGKTVLLATHDMPLAAKLCDNFIYLHEGAVHTSGTIAQLSALHGTTDLEEIFSRLVADTEEVLFG